MEQLVEISIPRTQTRKKNKLFNKLYTIYELKIILDDSFEYTLFKRYKEFRLFHDKVKEILKEDYIFPKFPGRTMSSMNPSVISKRRSGLEKWLQHALSLKTLEKSLKTFLEIPCDILSKSSTVKLTDDEILIKDFNTKITSAPHCKTNIVDQFEKKFFCKRRSVKDTYLNLLLTTLAPLCSDEYVGSKALFALYKLCNSIHYREFDLVIIELSRLDTRVLSSIKLNDYLLKKRFGDGQIQAFYIVNELKNHINEQELKEVLNNDEEALNVLENWDGLQSAVKVKDESSASGDWRNLGSPDDEIFLRFRFLNKELEFSASFEVETDVRTLVHLLVTPDKRKTWDQKLVEMEELKRSHDDRCVRLLYSSDRNMYEFHSSFSICTSIYCTQLSFKSKTFSYIQPKGLLGKMNSQYKFETSAKNESSFILLPKETPIKRTSSNDDLLQDLERNKSVIKVSWKITLCENSKKFLLSDCFEETEILRRSYMKLKELAECRENKEVSKVKPLNSVLEACERKKLRQTTVFRKVSRNEDLEDFM